MALSRIASLVLALAIVALPALAQEAQSPELQACQWKVNDDAQVESQLRIALVRAQDRINELQAKLSAIQVAPAPKH